MPFKTTAKNSGGGFELPEAGNQPAVVVALIDLGTQESEYKGKVSLVPRILLVWELTTQKMSGSDHNHLLAKDYAFYPDMSVKSALRVMLEKWRGRAFVDGEVFDLTTLLGKSCLVDVVHGQSGSGNAYAKVAGVSALPRGMSAPHPKRKPVAWEIEGADRLPEHLDWLPFLFGRNPIDVIRNSQEWKAKEGKGAVPQSVPIPDDRDEAAF